jgi:hypothetical protein
VTAPQESQNFLTRIVMGRNTAVCVPMMMDAMMDAPARRRAVDRLLADTFEIDRPSADKATNWVEFVPQQLQATTPHTPQALE